MRFAGFFFTGFHKAGGGFYVDGLVDHDIEGNRAGDANRPDHIQFVSIKQDFRLQ